MNLRILEHLSRKIPFTKYLNLQHFRWGGFIEEILVGRDTFVWIIKVWHKYLLQEIDKINTSIMGGTMWKAGEIAVGLQMNLYFSN